MHTLGELRTLFGFTDDDLIANRAGYLSEVQRERFRHELRSAAIGRAAATLIAPILPVAACAFIIFSLNYGDALGPLVLVSIAVWLAGVYLLLRFGHRAITRWLEGSARTIDHPVLRRLRAVNAAGEAAVERGIVERTAGVLTFPTDGEHIYVMLNEIEFTSNVAAEQDDRLWQLDEGRRYAIYYVPETLWIASVEPLAETAV